MRGEPNSQRVYFALSGKEVKIGVAQDPFHRVAAMRTARPDVKLFGDVPGGREVETDLHHRFSQDRAVERFTRAVARI